MKRAVLLSLVLSILCVSMISLNFQIEVIPANTPTLIFPTSAWSENSNFIDATQSTTYGTITNAPPSGMGNSDLNNRTTLTEASYLIDNPDLYTLESADFATTPSGWTLLQWTVGSGVAYAQSNEARLLSTKAYDLSSYYKVQLDFDFASYDTNYIENGDYRVAIKTGASTTEYTNIPARTSTSLTAMSTIQETTSYNAVVITWQDVTAADNERLKIDNVLVRAISQVTRYRFQAVFRFDGVILGQPEYSLEVIFYSALGASDDLDFYLEAGDTTPDNLVADDKQDSFSVDVTEYITGETVYLSILDDYRDTDSIQTSAYISAIYLHAPSWNTIVEPQRVYFDTPAWVIVADQFFKPVTSIDMTTVNWLLIFFGMCLIPTSTVYLVYGGRKSFSTDKLFYGLIAFVIGWGLLLAGIGFV